ncbi:phosphatase PAP2 family protein [Sinomonas sp. P47F7]|uniref:phosphatase PAP2 family protein n=1 Tax=Sinomonas sp. P47F7 TaxID=3410987 RepID=UPI003BF4FD79
MASTRARPDPPSPPRHATTQNGTAQNGTTQHGTTPRDTVAGPGMFVAAALACAMGVAGTYWFFVRTTTGQYIDESALDEAVELYGGRAAKAALGFLDALPTIAVVLGIGGLIYAAVVKGRWSAALIAFAGAALANVATQVLKAYVFTRPFRGVETLMDNSLPSGHTTLAASAAAAVFLVSSPAWRPFVAWAGGTFAILSGGATLVNQWHRPSDVIAAFLVVGAIMSPAGWLIMRTGGRRNSWRGFGSHWAASRLWLALPVLAGLCATGLAVSLLTRPAAGSGITSTTHYFWAGISLIVISGYLLTVAATWLFAVSARRD